MRGEAREANGFQTCLDWNRVATYGSATMKTIVTTSVLLLIVCAGSSLRGKEPPTRGRVLILENDRTLEGDIARYGDQYSIRRTIGETWMPADKVVALCESYEDAYRMLRGRANLADPDERVRLARWCQRHELREQALAEAAEAVRLKPDHPEARRLLNHLQRPVLPASEPAAPAEVREAEPLGVVPDLGTEALGQFVHKVQPILMNACASCHATGRGGAFKIVRTVGTGAASTRGTQQNLASVLAQINLEQPQSSPLLVKAIAIHGEASQPPLKGRQAAAYHTLENWVRLTTSRTSLRDPTAKTAALPSTTEGIAESSKPRTSDWAAESRPKPVPKSNDPFDPAAFNRLVQPPRP